MMPIADIWQNSDSPLRREGVVSKTSCLNWQSAKERNYPHIHRKGDKVAVNMRKHPVIKGDDAKKFLEREKLIDAWNAYNSEVWKIVDREHVSIEKARKIYEMIPGHLERPPLL